LPRLAVVQHLRVLVIDLADAMPTVVAHDRKALALRDLLDRMADVAERRARLDLADAREHRLIRRVDQLPRDGARRADRVHAARVAEVAVLDDGHVDVDDVAVLEDLAAIGDAVAY